jgi:hypothetical protein
MIEFKYQEGRFEGSGKINSDWIEYKANNNIKYYFKLQAISDNHLIIKSNDRDLLLKFPLNKGQSYISIDKGRTWQNWWQLY